MTFVFLLERSIPQPYSNLCKAHLCWFSFILDYHILFPSNNQFLRKLQKIPQRKLKCKILRSSRISCCCQLIFSCGIQPLYEDTDIYHLQHTFQNLKRRKALKDLKIEISLSCLIRNEGAKGWTQHRTCLRSHSQLSFSGIFFSLTYIISF